MTHHDDGPYLSFPKRSYTAGKQLGSASRFISFVHRQEREKAHLQDQAAITPSQDVFSGIEDE